RLGAFGDIIHTLPLAADLHRAGHTIGWVCEDRWACVLQGSPVVRHVHQLPRKGLRTSGMVARWLLLRRLARELRAGDYDVVIDAQGLAKSAVVAALSGAGRRIGHARPRSREGAWLISGQRVPVSATHVIDQQRALGLPMLHGAAHGGWSFPLPPWDAQRQWAIDWLTSQGLDPRSGRRPLMLNVGAGWPTKVWPQDRQIAFAQACAARSLPLVLVWGSPDEQAIAKAIVAGCPGTHLAPFTTIPQLAGLIAQARVLVSGDTGPLHLGLALNVPAVGLFGPVPATRNGPRGQRYRTLQAPGAAWERKDVSKVDMGALSAEAVLAAALAVAGADLDRNASAT
ncbi:MAG TPA: glycosyltransferase family 9 protein, partial [Planctomycetota bacterium]|nr:glycosyltransferase family 9 protein [Planctomycetota bacterium]